MKKSINPLYLFLCFQLFAWSTQAQTWTTTIGQEMSFDSLKQVKELSTGDLLSIMYQFSGDSLILSKIDTDGNIVAESNSLTEFFEEPFFQRKYLVPRTDGTSDLFFQYQGTIHRLNIAEDLSISSVWSVPFEGAILLDVLKLNIGGFAAFGSNFFGDGLTTVALFDEAGNYEFLFNSVLSTSNGGHSIQEMPDGNLLIALYENTTLQLIKVDANNGTVLWEETQEIIGSTKFVDLVVLNDDIYCLLREPGQILRFSQTGSLVDTYDIFSQILGEYEVEAISTNEAGSLVIAAKNNELGSSLLELNPLGIINNQVNYPLPDDITLQENLRMIKLSNAPNPGFLMYGNAQFMSPPNTIGILIKAEDFAITNTTLEVRNRIDIIDNCQVDLAEITAVPGLTTVRLMKDNIDVYKNINAIATSTFDLAPGNYDYDLFNSNVFIDYCENAGDFELPEGTQQSIDLSGKITNLCPLPTVEIINSQLRRCYENKYTVQYCNQGLETFNATTLSVTLDPFFTLTGASADYIQTGNVLTFSRPALSAGDCEYIDIFVEVNCDASIGQEHCVSTSVIPTNVCLLTYPEIPWSTENCKVNIGSYDPNDKTALTQRQDSIALAETPEYQIRFQNTGTDTAFLVVIRDTLSSLVDPLQVRPGAASHPYTFDIEEDGSLKFTFDNIMLPDSNVNEVASHGFIKFSVPFRNPEIGDVLDNTAHIYFDFNEAIVTNTVSQVIAESLYNPTTSIDTQINDFEIQLFPNPTKNKLYLSTSITDPTGLMIECYDLLGRSVFRMPYLPEVEVQDLTKGVYFLTLWNKDRQRLQTLEFVKQ